MTGYPSTPSARAFKGPNVRTTERLNIKSGGAFERLNV